VVYRRYASLFFVVAVDGDDDNELSILEFIHSLVETMDKYFESVCELDVSLVVPIFEVVRLVDYCLFPTDHVSYRQGALYC
jgi:hypothetical protein